MIKKYCVLDLDGTLADHRHRLAPGLSWDEANDLIDNDGVYEGAKSLLVRWQESGGKVIVLSSRSAVFIERTRKWLADKLIEPDVLILRPDKNYFSDAHLKVVLIDEYFGSREEAQQAVAFVLDDSEAVVTAFRNAGFMAWLAG
jgi:hydroxymethylpyrimidine pyrophosphatase-like HAD family hydrolase